jgi:excisionase family DNA binding protein
MAKISIASRRRGYQAFPKSSGIGIAMMPQKLQTEADAKFESTEELVKLLSNLNQILSQQEHIQISLTLTRTAENKIKMDLNSQPNRDVKRILTSDEVCDILKISKNFLYKYARMGVIPGFKVGNKWRFEADSIFKFSENVVTKI